MPRLLLVCPENLSVREAALATGLAAVFELWIVVQSREGCGSTPPNTRVVPLGSLRKRRTEWNADFVVYASPPAAALHWRIWGWKRRHARGGLLGGYWRLPAGKADLGRLQRWALMSLDFCLVNDEAAARDFCRLGVPQNRLHMDSGPETIADFLMRRRAAEERSVLWVDGDISLHSPSTKHLVYSIPHLRAEGWEVRGWCVTADAAAREGTEIHEFPRPPARLSVIAPYWFFVQANLHGIAQTILKGRPPARIVHTVGSTFLGADIAAIHFVHHVWLRKQLELRPRSRKAMLELLWTFVAMLRDQLQYRNPRCRLLLPVSDSIAQAVRDVCLPWMAVEVLPNSYDETRFNPEVRAQWRAPVRETLGFAEKDVVFCFASQGHYRRKGFWLAVDSLVRLRAAQSETVGRRVRLLVVGGLESTLNGLRHELATKAPGWESWITFVGTQAEVERYLSTADAFLFPSYFEAFCLAEIENGALGLPLLLTAHPGVEMILQDGVNGLLLSFDPAEIARALADFLAQGLPPFAASPGRALTRAEYARTLAGIYQRCLDGSR